MSYTDDDMNLADLSAEERLALADPLEDTPAPDSEPDAQDTQQDTPAPEPDKPDSTAAPRDQPVYQVDLPPDIQAAQQQIQAALSKLDQQWEDGELDFGAYQKQARQLQNQEQSINFQLQKAQIAMEMAGQAWERDAKQFIADHPEYGKAPVLFDALDSSIRRIANDPANADRPNYWILQEADKQVKGAFGQPASAAPPPKPTPGKKPDIPRTLGDVPAAAENDRDPYASLDKLSGLDLEDRIARMSRDDRQRYLRN